MLACGTRIGIPRWLSPATGGVPADDALDGDGEDPCEESPAHALPDGVKYEDGPFDGPPFGVLGALGVAGFRCG
jgi:hypothetical protein